MLSQLIPAGKKVKIKKLLNWREYINDFFTGFDYVFTSSGTAALVYALNVLKKKQRNKSSVIVPAYTCPDVLSAIIAAGLKPIIVDIEKNTTTYNADKLHNAISDETLAIIAVDLFGIPEDYTLLNNIKKQHGIFIIRDSAQCFPAQVNYFKDTADITILSFGRGKPVSLLECGMVLFDKNIQHVNNNQLNKLDRFVSMRYLLKVIMYNTLIIRNIYWWIEHVPMLKIGKTEYNEFNNDIVTNSVALKYLPANIKDYLSTSNNIQTELIDNIKKLQCKDIILPFNTSQIRKDLKMNRLPLLIQDKYLRETLYKKLHSQGLGVSKMYPTALSKVKNVPAEFREQECLVAGKFAEMILTLPVHAKVTRTDMANMMNVIKECINNQA